MLRKTLDERGFDITKQVHYTYSLINKLKQIKFIDCTCAKGKHEISSCKKQVNYIITKIYPELKIPRLIGLEYITVKNTFLKISAAHQELYPGDYNIAYQYTFHRILNINYPNREHILELLRFIYPQKQESFRAKDNKLKTINESIHCFAEFQPLPVDIYTNILHYCVKKRFENY
jgi:hypothetical protein